jgi:multidrug efflux pump subunit AcrA (membrane-fusion protein)
VFVAPEPKAKPVAPPASPVGTTAASKVPAPIDPVKAVLADEEQRVEREQLIARLAAERDAAAAVVLRREKDLLAFKNPFLPRPQLAADEAAEIKGLGGAARARWADRRVADAKAKLEEAQKAYDAAKANP